MTRTPPTLRELMESAARRHGNERRPASGRRLGEIAKTHGWDIDRTTINHLLGGTYNSRPGRRTLVAVAHLAGVPEHVAWEAAGRSFPETPFSEQLPPDVDDLTLPQRKAVIGVIRAMLEPAKGADEEADRRVAEATEQARRDLVDLHQRGEKESAPEPRKAAQRRRKRDVS